VLRARFLVALVLAASVLTAAPPRAPAKEHMAACTELAGMITRVRAGLEAASGQRLRGSSLGAYQVLRATTASMVRDSAGGRCGALGPTLTAALARADSAHTALDASVELDLGLDAALSLATDGRMPAPTAPPKLPPIGEAAVYGQDCPDLFPLTARLDGPRETLAGRVAALLAELHAHPRCGRVLHTLDGVPAERLAYAVDSVRLDEPDDPSASAELGVMSRCPELPQVVERLGAAIDVGAPLYNEGDARGCRQTYEEAARAITSHLIAEGRCPTVRTLLGAGLARAQGAPNDSQAAWDLRHSFDAILAGEPAAAP
jgi:hypothetical protein